MTSKNWSPMYLAYCRAHGIDPAVTMVRASSITTWIRAEVEKFRVERPDSMDFDGWISSRYPELEAVVP